MASRATGGVTRAAPVARAAPSVAISGSSSAARIAARPPSPNMKGTMVPPGSAEVGINRMTVQEGDFVILFERYDKMQACLVTKGESYANKFGTFRHDDMIGKEYGSRIKASTKGAMGVGFMYMLPPTPDLWTVALPHRTQILYTADICLVVANLELRPGLTVVESGTGSGSLSSSLARAVAPTGKLYTFEFNEMRVEKAKEDFAMTGVDGVTTVTHQDVLQNGFTLPGIDLENSVDAVFLDLPSPWDAVQHAKRVLKAGGRLCNFSPCIEQVQKASEKMRELGFSEVRTFEILIRQFDVKLSKPEVGKKRKSREEYGHEGNAEGKIVTKAFPEMKGHTGYLTFASLKKK